MTDTQILQGRLKEIDGRRAELEQLLAREPQGTYRSQELQSEFAELYGLRRSIVFKLASFNGPGPSRVERIARERHITAEVNMRRASLLEWIQRLEQEGDFRNARLWRRELLELRSQVEAEFSK